MGKSARVGAAVVLAAVAARTQAGRLAEVEKKAGEKDEPKQEAASSAPAAPEPRRRHVHYGAHAQSSTSYFSDGVGEGFLAAMFGGMASSLFLPDDAGPRAEEAEPQGDWADAAGFFSPRHRPGKMTMPYLRVDYHWQYLEHDLDAQDWRVEGGYALIGLQGRRTTYVDHLPNADPRELAITQAYAMLRLCGPPQGGPNAQGVGLGLGAGGAWMVGNERHASGALTLPLKLYLDDVMGLEFRPAWYRWNERMIGDYDASVSAGWRFIQGRVGYRWLWMQGQGAVLDGPYAGISVAF